MPLICGAGDVDLWRWRLLIQNEERCMSGITSFYNRMLLYPLLGEYMFGKGTSTHKSVFRPTADCLPENRQRDYMPITPRGPVEHKNKIRIRIDSEHVSCRLPKSILLIRGALRNSLWLCRMRSMMRSHRGGSIAITGEILISNDRDRQRETNVVMERGGRVMPIVRARIVPTKAKSSSAASDVRYRFQPRRTVRHLSVLKVNGIGSPA